MFVLTENGEKDEEYFHQKKKSYHTVTLIYTYIFFYENPTCGPHIFLHIQNK